MFVKKMEKILLLEGRRYAFSADNEKLTLGHIIKFSIKDLS